MEDELWLKKIKDKLEDYSEPLPVAGWERLEKELSVSGAPITGPHRMIPFRRWAVAAAAVLLVAVSSVSLWLWLRTSCRNRQYLPYGLIP